MATRRQLVGGTAAKYFGKRVAADGPGEGGFRLVIGEQGKIKKRIGGGMPATHDERPHAAIAIAIRTGNIRDAIGDAIAELLLPFRRPAIGAKRIRILPGSRRVNDGTRLDLTPVAFRIAEREGKRCRFAVRGLHPIEPQPRNPHHACVRFDDGCQFGCRGQGFEIVFNKVAPRRQLVRGWAHPAILFEKPYGRFIDALFPDREEADMAPVAQIGRDLRCRFEHADGLATQDQMRGGGKADRTGANDRDGKCLVHLLSPNF